MSKSRPDQPAGPYVAEPNPSAQRREELITEIERSPKHMRQLVAGLSEAQLNTPYKQWTIRQIVHHLADSHLNAYVRTRLALTEDNPTIKPYDESRWSELPDSRTIDPEHSLAILEGLHARWAATFRSMQVNEFDRTYFHPELARPIRLAEVLGLYVWHGRHHSEMIAWLRQADPLWPSTAY